MSTSTIITRGFLFDRKYVVTAGYLSGTPVPPPSRNVIAPAIGWPPPPERKRRKLPKKYRDEFLAQYDAIWPSPIQSTTKLVASAIAPAPPQVSAAPLPKPEVDTRRFTTEFLRMHRQHEAKTLETERMEMESRARHAKVADMFRRRAIALAQWEQTLQREDEALFLEWDLFG